jgi:hypothetical protein
LLWDGMQKSGVEGEDHSWHFQPLHKETGGKMVNILACI